MQKSMLCNKKTREQLQDEDWQDVPGWERIWEFWDRWLLRVGDSMEDGLALTLWGRETVLLSNP